MKISLLAGLSSVMLLQPTVGAVQAGTAEDESILLSPTSKRYELKAGSERKDTFTIVNDGQSAFDFVTYTRPYSVTDEQYTADFVSNAKNADAYKWVQFDQPSYQTTPGQTIEVPFTIRVPANATPGGHYGVLFAETLPSSASTGTGVKTKKRVGAIMYVTVEGDITRSGKVLETSVPFLQFSKPLRASQRIQNSGNTDFELKTQVRVSDVFGGVKYSNERSLAVLPNTVRQVESNWENPAWVGLYKITLNTDLLDNKTESTHYVLYVPVWIYIVLGLLIAIRVFYAAKTRKKR